MRLLPADFQFDDNWDRYLGYMASTINYVRALLDCDVILGGYVGAYLEPYLDEIR